MKKPKVVNSQRYYAVQDLETIKKYQKLSLEQKLSWLAESAEFFYLAMDEKAKRAAKFFD